MFYSWRTKSGDTKPAMKNDLNDTFRYLVQKFGSYTVLRTFITTHRYDFAITLLRDGAHVNSDLSFSKTPLHLIAAKSPSDKIIEICNLLLSRGAKVNAVDQFGWTPLHYAAKWRRISICELLVRHSANVNAVSKTGETPLHIAAKGGNADTVRLLLRNGAAVNAVNNCGEGPLHVLGRKYGRVLLPKEAVTLLEKKNIIRALSLVQRTFVKRTYPEVVTMLLQNGADIDARDELGETPLHVAVASFFVDMAQILVSKNCNVNAKTNKNFTALHFAVLAGHLELVELLLKKGADINAVTLKSGLTPLDMALKAGLGQIAMLLFQNQLKVNSQIKDDVNLLHLAIRMGCDKFVKEMLKNCSDRVSLVRALSSEGCASLHVAAKHGRFRIVRLLLSCKADVNVLDASGNTPLYYASSAEMTSVLLSLGSTGRTCPDLLPDAVKENRMDLVELVLDDGANVDARDANGMTALHIAAVTGNERFVPLLIDQGADVESRDTRNGYSALHFAARKSDNAEIIETLLIRGADVDSSEPVVEKVGRNAWGECLESSQFCGRFENLNTEEIGSRIQCSSLYDNEGFLEVAQPSSEEGVWGLSGKTPLFVAIDAGCDKNVEVLLKHGADVNITYNGRTPLQSAQEKNRSNELIHMLQIHIIRLKTAGLLINERDLPSDYFQYLTTELQKELSELKRTKIGGSNAFFYDFLMKSPNKSAILYRRENIGNILNSDSWSFLHKFPQYGFILCHRLRSAEKRWSLLKKATFQLQEKLPLSLPDLCIDVITGYLSNRDLCALIIALSAPNEAL